MDKPQWVICGWFVTKNRKLLITWLAVLFAVGGSNDRTWLLEVACCQRRRQTTWPRTSQTCGLLRRWAGDLCDARAFGLSFNRMISHIATGSQRISVGFTIYLKYYSYPDWKIEYSFKTRPFPSFFPSFFVIRTWKQVHGTAVCTPYVTFSRSEREVKFQNFWLINASDSCFWEHLYTTEVFFTFPLMGFELRLLS